MKSEKIRFPAWIENYTAQCIQEIWDREPLFWEWSNGISHRESLAKVVDDLRMEKAWVRAKKYFPNLPARGQVELVYAIWRSFPVEGDRALPERQADLWKQKFMTHITEAIKLWSEAPRNFQLFSRGVDEYMALMNSWKHKPTEDELNFVLNDMVGDAAYLKLFRDIVEKADYSALDFRTQVAGLKAERLVFVRQLSGQLKELTGKWERESVSVLAECVFDQGFSAKEVARATKDWEPGEYFLDRSESDEHWLSRINRCSEFT